MVDGLDMFGFQCILCTTLAYLVSSIDKDKFAQLKAEGRVADGMIPKLTNSFKAIDSGVARVIIKHARNLLGTTGTTLI